MRDSTQYLERLESEVRGQGHPEADLAWARDAYFRLVLSRVKSSPAQGEVRRAAAEARDSGVSLEQAHGPSGTWAESVARGWVTAAPERFAGAESPAEPSWSPRSAVWAIPALATGLSLAFSLMGLIPGWDLETLTLGWILLPGLLAVPVVAVHAVYHSALVRWGNTLAVAAAVVATVALAVAIAWLVTQTVTAPLPTGVAWDWLALAGYLLLAVAGWLVARQLPGSGVRTDAGLRIRVHPAGSPVDDEAWEQQFRAALYLRGGRRDREVERAAQEALGHARDSGHPAVEEFGSPWDYARTLTEDPVVRPRRATVFYAALSLLWLGLAAGYLLEPGAETTWGEVVFRAALGVLLLAASALRAREWREAARSRDRRRAGPAEAQRVPSP